MSEETQNEMNNDNSGLDEHNGNADDQRHHAFMVTQFLAEPFSDDWMSDRKTLKPGVKPWISEEQIKKAIDNHNSIKESVWCWHDRDIYTKAEEEKDKTGRVKEGDRKFKHAMIAIRVPGGVTSATVAKWFGVPEGLVKPYKGHGAFLEAVEYLVHENPASVLENKTHYDDSEMHASRGFDFRSELNVLQDKRKSDANSKEKTPSQRMMLGVLQDGWTLRECQNRDPLTYSNIKAKLPPLRLDYLLNAPMSPFRLNIYVYGEGGLGKSTFCIQLAKALYPANDYPYFFVGNDARVTFDGYDGEPVLIFEDMRAYNFITQFGPDGTYTLLDPYPKKAAQQAKYSRVILNNEVNIINGVQPHKDFISGIAGTYKDKDGHLHEAEDEKQAWRRFPLVINIDRNAFQIFYNKGIMNDCLDDVNEMELYGEVDIVWREVMQKLSGAALDDVLGVALKPVLDMIQSIRGKMNTKISDAGQIPAELLPTIKSADDVKKEEEEEKKELEAQKKEYQKKLDEKRAAEHEAYLAKEKKKKEEDEKREEKKRLKTLQNFAEWFWGKGEMYKEYINFHVGFVGDPVTDLPNREWDLMRMMQDDKDFAKHYISIATDSVEQYCKLWGINALNNNEKDSLIGTDRDYDSHYYIKDIQSSSTQEICDVLADTLKKIKGAPPNEDAEEIDDENLSEDK